MEDKIFLLVKVTISTTHSDIHDAIKELQSKTDLQLSSTQNVRVLKTEIMQLRTRTH
jgi:NAD-dependent SIR2 family protein deacetylase